MPPKRTSTSETPAITLDAIRQLIADFTAALEAQTAAMVSASNLTRTPAVKTGNYKEFISCQPSAYKLDYITPDLAVQASVCNQDSPPEPSTDKKQKIKPLKTTLEDIQVHQNLLQSENPDHQASILVVYYSRILLYT
ncbi:hypothetical protein Tco_0659863 [Tanacetum coccineum]